MNSCHLRISLCRHLRFFYKDDGLNRAVAGAGTAFNTNIDINVGLSFALLDGIIFTAGNTSSTLDTDVSHYVWQLLFTS